MNVTKKITPLQACSMLILSLGVTNHVLLIPVLLGTAKRDAWAGTLAAVLPALLLASLLARASRVTGHEGAAERLRHTFGNPLARFMAGAAAGYAFLMLAVTIKDMATWTQVSYLPDTPILAISLAFLFICGFGAYAGIRAIAISSGILLPIVVALGFFVSGVNFQFKDYSLLLPLFTHGFLPAGRAMLYAFASTFELVVLLFFQQHIAKTIKPRQLLLLTLLAIGLTAGPLIGAITIFGPFEAAELRYPPFEQWRMVVLGRFISHLDFLSIFQWLSGSFVRIALNMFLIAELLGFRSKQRRAAAITATAAVAAAITLYPISDMAFLQFMESVYFPVSAGIASLLLIAVLVTSAFEGRRRMEGRNRT